MDCKLSHKIGFYQRIVGIVIGRRADLIVSALDSRLDGPGWKPGRDNVLCSWARHFTLTVPLSIQVYEWTPTNLMLG